VGQLPVKNSALIFFSGLILLLNFSDVVADEIKQGMRFRAAINLIKHQQWRPFDVHAQYGYELIGLEKKLYDLGFNAIESCSFEQAICVFNYIKNNRCLRLMTIGERMKDMTVYQWSFECPQHVE
jgi:hypothetical protein